MAAFRGPKVWLWRWRRNPLRRRSDELESWLLLATWTLMLVTGLLAGLGTAHAVESTLAQQRAEWHPVLALTTENTPAASTSAASHERIWAEVRWTAADGAPHTGQARVDPGSTAGTPVVVWTDRDGHLVTKPASAHQAGLRAGMSGVLVGACAAAVPLGGGRLLRKRLDQRRMEQWDAEWEKFGPQWGRKTG
ncbi:Rv1733c family protein [Streptomyces sp. CA-288835]|uniref:Rv1733c family protein n=1 Tax=Streptomyces sp. CA-288835 TaxID=3240069 RepID=UPI003D8D9902